MGARVEDVLAVVEHQRAAGFDKMIRDDVGQIHSRLLAQVQGSGQVVQPGRDLVAHDATAFAYREANFAPVIAGMWPDPEDNEANIRWVRDFYDATAPLSEEGGYVNFMADDDQERIRANYRQNYDRLDQVKRAYDPDNLFHLNQNIRP